jgi:hypothetical protein
MSGTAAASEQQSQSPFNPRAMLIVVAIGAVAFIAMLVLGAYAPDLRSGRNGGSHALSNAATGFSGIVRLAEQTGRNPHIVRSENELRSEDLAVITPEHGWVPLGDVLKERGPRATLIVLPKWDAAPDKQRAGWVRVSGLLPAEDPARTLAPTWPFEITRLRGDGKPLRSVHPAAPPQMQFFAPRVVQTIANAKLKPLITDGAGRIVLGQIDDQALYILADPDLLDNHGMADERQARAALAMLDFLNSTDSTSVLFDVTANGLGRSRSPLKLAFDPPFLAVTLTIFAAMLLAAAQALVRFGAPRRTERAIAFGKAALVDNSAALVRKAGREASLGSRYVEVIRQRAAALFRLPPTTSAELLDERLESLNPRRSFHELAAATSQARTRAELLSAAQSLHHWVEEVQE